MEIQCHRIRQLDAIQHRTIVIRQDQCTTPCCVDVHPRAILIGDFTNLFEGINCTSISCTSSCHHTCHDLAFRLKMRHGFFQSINIHLRIFIDRNSHNGLEAHAHHRHVLLHREVCIFRTDDFDVTHCIRRDTITLNRPRITVFVFPVFRYAGITCK